MKSRSWVWISVVILVILFFVIWSFIAIRSETAHREISKSYAVAAVLYNQIDFSKPYKPSMNSLLTETLEKLQTVTKDTHHFPEWYLAYAQMGFLYIYKNQISEAIPFLEKVMDAPRDFLLKTQSLIALARIYANQNDIDKAIKIYHSLESNIKKEELDFVRYQLAILYTQKSDKTSLTKALELYGAISPESSLVSLAQKNTILVKNMLLSPNK